MPPCRRRSGVKGDRFVSCVKRFVEQAESAKADGPEVLRSTLVGPVKTRGTQYAREVVEGRIEVAQLFMGEASGEEQRRRMIAAVHLRRERIDPSVLGEIVFGARDHTHVTRRSSRPNDRPSSCMRIGQHCRLPREAST